MSRNNRNKRNSNNTHFSQVSNEHSFKVISGRETKRFSLEGSTYHQLVPTFDKFKEEVLLLFKRQGQYGNISNVTYNDGNSDLTISSDSEFQAFKRLQITSGQTISLTISINYQDANDCSIQ